MGFIDRNRDPKDERRVRISLTANGLKLREKALTIPSCIISATGLSQKTAINFQEQIFVLRDNLKKVTDA